MKEFLEELVLLCKKHDVVIFARSNGERYLVSFQNESAWVDARRVSGDGAKPAYEEDILSGYDSRVTSQFYRNSVHNNFQRGLRPVTNQPL